MLIISNINSSFPCPCALWPLLFPWPQHWDTGLGFFFPLSFCSLFKPAESIYYSVGAKYKEKPTILSFSSLHTPPPLLPLSALFSDFRALSNSFFWDQLQARSPASCDVLGETEWDGDEGKVLWVGQGKHIPIWLKPIFCSLCLSWFHPHPLLYFTENGGSAREGAHIWVPDSHWLSHPSPALEGLSVQLALPFFLASEQRGSNWGSSEQSQGLLLGWLWAAVGCFLWPLQFKALDSFQSICRPAIFPLQTQDEEHSCSSVSGYHFSQICFSRNKVHRTPIGMFGV